jgi:FAD/FMN-containing dehydrogenase
MFAVGMAPNAAAASAVEGAVGALRDSLEPWQADEMYSNFAETRREAGSFHNETAYRRLKRIKAQVDPDNLIRANHEL